MSYLSTLVPYSIQTDGPEKKGRPRVDATHPILYLPKVFGLTGLINSEDPDQMLQSAASDLGLHCLPQIQQILNMNM